jgi:hypothetical protein
MNNNILTVAVIVLIAIIVFQRTGCGPNKAAKGPDTVTVHDTTYDVHDSLIVKKMTIYKTLPPVHDTLPPQYVADTNYAKLKIQYENLLGLFLARNVYVDSLKLDSVGYVVVSDTLSSNKLNNRGYQYNYKIPTIHTTTTITKYAPLKNQLYAGGGIGGNKTLGITNLNAGLLLKTKSDKIYSVTVGTNTEGQISYGFQTFWKFKK